MNAMKNLLLVPFRLTALALTILTRRASRILAKSIGLHGSEDIVPLLSDVHWYIEDIPTCEGCSGQHALWHDDEGEFNGAHIVKVHRWGPLVLACESVEDGVGDAYLLAAEHEAKTDDERSLVRVRRKIKEDLRDTPEGRFPS